MDLLNRLLKERCDLIDNNNKLWTIKDTDNNGRGLFTTTDVNEGEIIFKDVPVVLGPRFTEEMPGCAICLRGGRPLKACPNNCGLPICYDKLCEEQSSKYHYNDCLLLRKFTVMDSGHWSPNIYRVLALIRCLNISSADMEIVKLLYSSQGKETHIQVAQLKQHLNKTLSDEDESWLLHSCGVLDGTAFEIPHANDNDGRWSLRGLYPLAAMMNHDCRPNTRHIYNWCMNDIGIQLPIMSVIALKRIPKNMEITTIYCPQLWSTQTRRQFLYLTKKFLCKCERCRDPTEFNTYLSAIKCSCNNGILLPASPLNLLSIWKCNQCMNIVDTKEILSIQKIATKLDLKNQLLILPPSNYLIVQKKLDKIWKNAKKMDSLSLDNLQENLENIQEILILLKQLSVDNSRLSGLIYIELYKTMKEQIKRNNNVTKMQELMKIKMKINNILKGDSTINGKWEK